MVIAILDIHPINAGHSLVIPRRHAVSVMELTFEERAQLMDVGTRVAAAFGEAGIRAEGFNLFLADGEAAGQDVFHAHLHVIPRFGDKFALMLPPGYGGEAARTELDAVAERLRANFV